MISMMTFYQATLVLEIFVHVRNISAVTDQILNVGSWDHLEQIPTIMVTFVQATFFMVTFVHIKNILAVIHMILTKL